MKLWSKSWCRLERTAQKPIIDKFLQSLGGTVKFHVQKMWVWIKESLDKNAEELEKQLKLTRGVGRGRGASRGGKHLQWRHTCEERAYESEHYERKFFGLPPAQGLCLYSPCYCHALHEQGSRSQLASQDKWRRWDVCHSHLVEDQEHAAAQAVACYEGGNFNQASLFACTPSELMLLGQRLPRISQQSQSADAIFISNHGGCPTSKGTSCTLILRSCE